MCSAGRARMRYGPPALGCFRHLPSGRGRSVTKAAFRLIPPQGQVFLQRSCPAGSHLKVGFAERSTERTISRFRTSPRLGLRITPKA